MRMFAEVLGGREEFIQVVSEYVDRFKYSNVDSKEMSSFFAKGDQRLEKFFLDWIQQV